MEWIGPLRQEEDVICIEFIPKDLNCPSEPGDHLDIFTRPVSESGTLGEETNNLCCLSLQHLAAALRHLCASDPDFVDSLKDVGIRLT